MVSDAGLVRARLTAETDWVALQRRLGAVTAQYSGPASLQASCAYLLRDLLYAAVTALLTAAAAPYVPTVLLFPVYSAVQGTVLAGIWVLGHECGHGTFAPTRLGNDAFGFVLHSALLVPFWSWRFSHRKHHKFTNHLVLGETHVPSLLGEAVSGDAFPILRIFVMMLGFPFYLTGLVTGSRTQSVRFPAASRRVCCAARASPPRANTSRTREQIPDAREQIPQDLKTPMDKRGRKDHLHSASQAMPNDWKIELGTVGCMVTMACLIAASRAGYSVCFWYFGPYLVVNAWLVLYTWLHHTHPDVPHYGADEFSRLKGALATIDRPYPWLIDHLHHHIGTTHVCHHICSLVPHYRAEECTERLRPLLGDLYLWDPRPIRVALYEVARECNHVSALGGVQFYRNKAGKVSAPVETYLGSMAAADVDSSRPSDVSEGSSVVVGRSDEGHDRIGGTKHPDSAEGGAWGCDWFAVPPSARGEDDSFFGRHGEIFSARNIWGTGGLYMCFVVWVIPLDILMFGRWGATSSDVRDPPQILGTAMV